jgi:putative transposase
VKRTAKYESLPLNKKKAAGIKQLVSAFAGAKHGFLRRLGHTAAWHYLDSAKKYRDACKHFYRQDVPVHLQDQAVFDAVATMVTFIESCLAVTHIKARIVRQFDGVKQRYAFWLLQRYARIGAILRGEAPVPDFLKIPPDERREVVRFLRRKLRKSLGQAPRVRSRRSVALDDTLYRAFEHHGRLYVAVSSMESRKRLIIPLRGRGRITGNVRLVWNQKRSSVLVHMSYAVKTPTAPPAGPNLGFDAGVTEVLASSSGEKYGEGYGTLLDRLSEETTVTGKARNRLHQLAKKAEKEGDIEKARRIRRNNLGGKKLKARRERGEAAVKTMVGRAVRTALRGRPAVVVMEDLSHMRGRTKTRKLSRIVSRWARSTLRERLEFRTQAGGSRLETVNAAYTSQTCSVPTCGYVNKDNRHGDRFHCLVCGWDGDADVAAARNLLSRLDDPEIRLWTPKERVRAVLMERFRRRKETLMGTPLPAGL